MKNLIPFMSTPQFVSESVSHWLQENVCLTSTYSESEQNVHPRLTSLVDRSSVLIGYFTTSVSGELTASTDRIIDYHLHCYGQFEPFADDSFSKGFIVAISKCSNITNRKLVWDVPTSDRCGRIIENIEECSHN